MNEVTQVLRRAAEFFKLNPNGFTTSVLARDADRVAVHPSNPRAVCWCAVGRIAREINVPDDGDPGSQRTYNAVRNFLGINDTSDITATNDEDGVEGVVKLFDEMAREHA